LKLGFIINPIAGMGGKVGLKGTDNVVEEAVRLGARPVAPQRGMEFLEKLKKLGVSKEIELITCPAAMGEEAIRSVGLDAEVLPLTIGTRTTAEDTKNAVKMMVQRQVDLIAFVGGDGTARDICDALTDSIPILGVPAGVKMYSGIFAVSPEDAAYIVEAFLKEETQLMDY
jgi:predicted polyphosphate/ATP-dependent NAD kinase